MEGKNIFLEINHFTSAYLNNFVLENNLEKIIWFFADSPIFFLPIFFIGFWFYYNFSEKLKNDKKDEKKSDLLFIFLGIIIAILVNIIIQNIFFFDRPDSIINPILKHVQDASFPSDHAAASFAFLSGLFFFGYKKIFWYFLPFVILMNLSRISGGLHWFFDVFVGLIVGIISAFLIFKKKKNIYLKNFNYGLIKIAKIFKL